MFTQISWGKELPMNCLFFFLFLFLKLPSLLIAWDLRNIRKLRAAYSVSENFIQLVSNRVPWWIGITKAIKFHPTWGVGEKSTQPPEVFHPRILLDGKKVLLQHPWQQRGYLGGEGWDDLTDLSVYNEVVVLRKNWGGSGWKVSFYHSHAVFSRCFFCLYQHFVFLLVEQTLSWRFARDSEFGNSAMEHDQMLQLYKNRTIYWFFLHHKYFFSRFHDLPFFPREQKSNNHTFGHKKWPKLQPTKSFRLRFYVRAVPTNQTRCFWLILEDGGQRIGLEVSKRDLRTPTFGWNRGLVGHRGGVG